MTVITAVDDAFASALRGRPFEVVGLHDDPLPLPVARWADPADAEDLAMVALCVGPTIDIGCGPGRLTAALAGSGRLALGIDVVGEAVVQTRNRGVAAVQRDVFAPVPGEGRWMTALLADGNIGIGGDPRALLRRVRALLAPGGRIVVEVARPGIGARTAWAELVSTRTRSEPFAWAVVGVDDIGSIALQAGLRVESVCRIGQRWCALLRREEVSPC